MKFEWDSEKEEVNINKHGITFEQASYVFADPFALNKYDDEHSIEEDSWLLLGKSINEVLFVVVHTFKDDDNIEYVRIISARKTTNNEQQTYQRRCLK
ncbi:MAG: BrnT family toxin [Gammaproteobacteria bacterium]|nr:BrnT family toxin [Gammaproteobacteria bacterium]